MVKPPKRQRSRLILPITEVRRIKLRLTGQANGIPSTYGYVCSDPWAQVCVNALEAGVVLPRKKLNGLERDLHRTGVYPPGGSSTSMVETDQMRWMPPTYFGTACDSHEDALTLAEGCKLPPSPSAVMIDRIRHRKSRKEKTRIRVKGGKG